MRTAAAPSLPALAALSERDWQRTVVELFRVTGWRVWHNTVAWRSDAGWPDLVTVHPIHGIRFLELKSERGRLSASQADWIKHLRAAGQLVYILRPSDWEHAQAIARGERLAATEGKE